MIFADNYCSYVEEYTPEGQYYVFKGKCTKTKKEHTVRVPAQELFNYRMGAKIQDALVSVSNEDREFLMSGLSPQGWKETFDERGEA